VVLAGAVVAILLAAISTCETREHYAGMISFYMRKIDTLAPALGLDVNNESSRLKRPLPPRDNSYLVVSRWQTQIDERMPSSPTTSPIHHWFAMPLRIRKTPIDHLAVPHRRYYQCRQHNGLPRPRRCRRRSHGHSSATARFRKWGKLE